MPLPADTHSPCRLPCATATCCRVRTPRIWLQQELAMGSLAGLPSPPPLELWLAQVRVVRSQEELRPVPPSSAPRPVSDWPPCDATAIAETMSHQGAKCPEAG